MRPVRSTSNLTRVVGTTAVMILLSLMNLSLSAQQLAINENPPEMKVKYIEGDNDVLLFNLKYNNNSGSDFKLMVLNESGDVLFQQSYSGKNFKKKIRLTRLTESDDVTFLIRSPRKNIQLSYKVKVPSKVVDDASLASMD
jgi:hypothetical protein